MLPETMLGKKTEYIEIYTPSLLFPIPRKFARDKIGLPITLPFGGVDVWNGFEISWLSPKGKPQIALAEYFFPCDSDNIIESKSFKLYLNSFNQSTFETIEDVQRTMEKDLTDATKSSVTVKLYHPKHFTNNSLSEFSGICLDDLDITTETYKVNSAFLKTSETYAQETVYSNLFKSNCLATGQPDWGSLLIRYSGKAIDHQGLLKYIISYRTHSGFGEHCIEQIYCELAEKCLPEKLTVYGRYTRRGGLDINPFRSNFETLQDNYRQARQ